MRKRFLIKPRLQLTHLFWTLGVLLISCCLGYILFETMVANSLGTGLLQHSDWILIRAHLRWAFLLVFTMLLVAIGIENYFLFHSIVGPLFVLERGLKKLGAGDFSGTMKIRDTDQLEDLILVFEDMKGKMYSKIEADKAEAQNILQELDRMINAAGDNSGMRDRLKELRTRIEKKTSS